MNDDEKDMLPCPFCGSKNVGIMPYENDTECEAYCRDCGCRTARASWIGAVVKVWNRRTAPPQYREPTLEDAREVYENGWIEPDSLLAILKQLGFVRRVQP